MSYVNAAHLIGTVTVGIVFYYLGYIDGVQDVCKDVHAYIASRKEHKSG